MRLIDFKKNVYSENGEDGILEEIFRLLSPAMKEEKWCVEFGAWDGKYSSNTFNLINSGWNGVYIEGDKNRFKSLLKTCKNYKKITPICAYVDYKKDSENNLKFLLNKTIIPSDYDLLSIDIDSFDLEVWATYDGRPKVVVIEIDSSIEPGIVQWHDDQKLQGNSFSAALECAEKKGYSLACHCGNMIFVRKDLLNLLDLDELDLFFPERLFVSNWIIKNQIKKNLKNLAKKFLPSYVKKIFKSS